MRFYTQQHHYTCGIDLHARSLYVCLLDDTGMKIVHKNIKATPEALLKLIADFQDDLIIGVECMFSWYWIADFCADHRIEFVLGHALYMKAIHGGKAKNDRIDSEKIARLLKGGRIHRNRWQLSNGMGGRLRTESVAGLDRNTHKLEWYL